MKLLNLKQNHREDNIILSDIKGKSVDILGKKEGISGEYIKQAKKIREENPVAAEKIKNGDLSIYKYNEDNNEKKKREILEKKKQEIKENSKKQLTVNKPIVKKMDE